MNLRVAIVAYAGLWDRLIKLLSNENLMGEDLKIYSSEDTPLGMDQSDTKTKQERWTRSEVYKKYAYRNQKDRQRQYR